jgi:hypothetical protein
MARKAALFIPIDIGDTKFFLRQAYYWVVVGIGGEMYFVQEYLMIFSTQEKAVSVAQAIGNDCTAEVWFWEELEVMYYNRYKQALVDYALDDGREYVQLDLGEEDQSEKECNITSV